MAGDSLLFQPFPLCNIGLQPGHTHCSDPWRLGAVTVPWMSPPSLFTAAAGDHWMRVYWQVFLSHCIVLNSSLEKEAAFCHYCGKRQQKHPPKKRCGSGCSDGGCYTVQSFYNGLHLVAISIASVRLLEALENVPPPHLHKVNSPSPSATGGIW